jgi:hypothetical protein
VKAIGRLFTILILTGTLLLLAALSLHVVRSGGRVRVIAKEHLTLVDTYEDVTNWSADDVARHSALVARLSDTGQIDLLPSGAISGELLTPARVAAAARK